MRCSTPRDENRKERKTEQQWLFVRNDLHLCLGWRPDPKPSPEERTLLPPFMPKQRLLARSALLMQHAVRSERRGATGIEPEPVRDRLTARGWVAIVRVVPDLVQRSGDHLKRWRVERR